MWSRSFWKDRIAEAWLRQSVVSVVGVRGAGKTMLARAAAPAELFDCSEPGTRELLARPDALLGTLQGRTVVLDDVGRLSNARELLGLAASRFPTVRILTTSTLPVGTGETGTPGWPPASTAAGRIGSVWLTPMTLRDTKEFGVTDIRRRMLHGGLPEFLLAAEPQGAAIEAWIDTLWARDIQETFRLESAASFRRLFELLMAQSGSMFEAARLAKRCGASRTTISNYLAALETAFAMHVIRPYAGGGRSEIVSAPKVYGFDPGFVCHYRGATTLRPADLGPLWEHLVLNELHAHVGRGAIRYWRTKHGSEVDFVLVRPGRAPVAVECCWSAGDFEPAAMRSFRGAYPGGASFVVTADTPDGSARERDYGPLHVTFTSPRDLVRTYQGG